MLTRVLSIGTLEAISRWSILDQAALGELVVHTIPSTSRVMDWLIPCIGTEAVSDFV